VRNHATVLTKTQLSADTQPIVAIAIPAKYPATNSLFNIFPLLTLERIGATSVTLFMVKPSYAEPNYF
jgi:hypothetical protein